MIINREKHVWSFLQKKTYHQTYLHWKRCWKHFRASIAYFLLKMRPSRFRIEHEESFHPENKTTMCDAGGKELTILAATESVIQAMLSIFLFCERDRSLYCNDLATTFPSLTLLWWKADPDLRNEAIFLRQLFYDYIIEKQDDFFLNSGKLL